MKKMMIFSLASLLMLSLTACKGAGTGTTPAGIDDTPGTGTKTDTGTPVITQTPASLITPLIKQTPASLITPSIKSFIITDSDLVDTLDEALKKPHVLKVLPPCDHYDIYYNYDNPDTTYRAVFDITTPGHTKYIGAYDGKNKVIIVDGGSQKTGTPFVKKGFYTGKIEHGEINKNSYEYLNSVKQPSHIYSSLTDDKDDNDIFRNTIAKHLTNSCAFTYN